MAEMSESSLTASFAQASRRRPLVVFFLDLDDVLITHRAAHGIGPGVGHMNTIDPVAMGMFNRLAEKAECQKETDVRVVLISARRRDRGIRQFLKRNGLAVRFHHHWRTDRDGPSRGHEVERWLKQHPHVSDYLIFDDGPDFLPEQLPRHIRPQPYNGLTFENFLQARKYLGLKATD